MTEEIHQSPRSIRPQLKQLNFANAIKMLADGKKVKRIEWGETKEYLVMQDEKLMIYKPDDGKLHYLVVSLGDIKGEDWIVLKEPEKGGEA